LDEKLLYDGRKDELRMNLKWFKWMKNDLMNVMHVEDYRI